MPAASPVPGEAKEGKREKVYPTLAEQMAASRIVLSRLIPELKAQEISGPDGAPLTLPVDPPSTRDLSKAILAVLGKGVPGGRVSVETPDTYTARFTDKALGERILGGDSGSVTGAFYDTGTSPGHLDDRQRIHGHPRVTGSGLLYVTANGMAIITRLEDRTDGRERWEVMDSAGMPHTIRDSREAAEAFAEAAEAFAEEKLKPRGQG